MRVKYKKIVNQIPEHLNYITNKLSKIKIIELNYSRNNINNIDFKPFLLKYIVPLKYHNEDLIYRSKLINNKAFDNKLILYNEKNELLKELDIISDKELLFEQWIKTDN